MEVEEKTCFVCGEHTANTQWHSGVATSLNPAFTSLPDGAGTRYDCPQCGAFKLQHKTEVSCEFSSGKRQRSLLSAWVREQNDVRVEPLITPDLLRSFERKTRPKFLQRVDRLLSLMYADMENWQQSIDTSSPVWIARTYSLDRSDFESLVVYAHEAGLVETVLGGGKVYFKLDGIIHVEDLQTTPTATNQVFVAMRFGEDDMNAAFDQGIHLGIINAGYKPYRVIDDNFLGKIDDRIISAIRGSQFVVADMTHHRQNVYFEAGFAIGLGLDVIYTCRQDHVDDLHFDIRQFNCIVWETPEDLASQLENRISALYGPA